MHRCRLVAPVVAVAVLAVVACRESVTSPATSELPTALRLSASPSQPNVCHRTNSKNGPGWQPLSVGAQAIPAHLRHGDFVISPTAPCPPAPHLSITGNPSFALDDPCNDVESVACEDTHTFTITNDGNATSGTVTVGLTNPSFDHASLSIVVNNCGTTLIVGGTCTVDVKFKTLTSSNPCQATASATLGASDGSASASLGLSGTTPVHCAPCTGTCGASYSNELMLAPWSRALISRREL